MRSSGRLSEPETKVFSYREENLETAHFDTIHVMSRVLREGYVLV
jgi:hypothetical protein